MYRRQSWSGGNWVTWRTSTLITLTCALRNAIMIHDTWRLSSLWTSAPCATSSCTTSTKPPVHRQTHTQTYRPHTDTDRYTRTETETYRPQANSAFHPSGWGMRAGKEKAVMIYSVSGWTRGAQVKLRCLENACHARGVFTFTFSFIIHRHTCSQKNIDSHICRKLTITSQPQWSISFLVLHIHSSAPTCTTSSSSSAAAATSSHIWDETLLSTTRFPMNPRRTSCVIPKPTKGVSKMQSVQYLNNKLR